ncbi:MAG: PorT family protein [Reichenbachiella sp.]
MKKLVSTTTFLLLFIGANAQFWIGPKAGITYTNNVYDDYTYKARYNVSQDINWHAGLSMDYDSDGRFVVHSELTYERVGNNVSNLSSEPKLEASSVYHFLSLPMMVRIIFSGRRSAVKFYGQAGPRMKFWLAGNGQTEADEFEENGFNGLAYNVRFKNVEDRDDSGITDPDESGLRQGAEFIVHKPNRVQYSLDIGGGMFMDLSNGQRLSVDAKFSWGHSNMGFNVEGDGLNLPTFDEDIEYSHNMLTLSVAYLFYFDPIMARKGKSTDGTKKKKYKGGH